MADTSTNTTPVTENGIVEQVPQIPLAELQSLSGSLGAKYYNGVIQGAVYSYCLPDNWNHKLIIFWYDVIENWGSFCPKCAEFNGFPTVEANFCTSVMATDLKESL